MTREFGTRGTWHRTIQAHLAHGTGHYWHQWNGHPYKTLGTSNSRRRRRLNSTTVTPNTGTGCNELSHREALFFIFYLLHRCSLEIVNLLRKVFRNGWNSKRLKSWYFNSLCFTKERARNKIDKHHSLSISAFPHYKTKHGQQARHMTTRCR